MGKILFDAAGDAPEQVGQKQVLLIGKELKTETGKYTDCQNRDKQEDAQTDRPRARD